MGCAATVQENQILYPQSLHKDQIVVGELTITVKSIKLERQFVHTKNNSFVKLRMSNQQFKSPITKQNGKIKTLDESFSFCANSINKIHGRMLVAEIFQEPSQSEKDVALGIFDLDQFITVQSAVSDYEERLYLDYETKAAGYINICIHFQPYPYQTINFRINTIFIRKNANSDRKCCVRIIVGEAIQQTSIKIDSTDCVPTWKNEQKTFIVPSFIGLAKIQVLQKSNNNVELLGELTLDLKLILSTHKSLMHNQVLYLDTKITGSIIFDTVKNKERDFQFQELISPRKNFYTPNEQIGQTKHSFNTQTMTQSKTQSKPTLMKPPIINPKKLPPINKEKIQEIKANKSLALSARNYKMIEQAFQQNNQSVQHQEVIKIIRIPSNIAKQQQERIRRSSADAIYIPTLNYNNDVEIIKNSSNANLTSINQQKMSNHQQQRANEHNDTRFKDQNLNISQIDQIVIHDDTSQNQSGTQAFDEINNSSVSNNDENHKNLD